MSSPVLFVTNFNRNFTGVSATAAGVVSVQQRDFALKLVGQGLPGCPEPISTLGAYGLSRNKPDHLPFSIWHVRRNSEMQSALIARDLLRLPIKTVFTSAAQRRHSAWPRFLISKMDAVIATTDHAASFVPNVRAVVPHGVDVTRFKPGQNREVDWQAWQFGGKFGIACVGRIRPEKGTDLFVESMLAVLPKHPDVIALVVGKAAPSHQSFLDMQKQKVIKAGLADRLKFVGEITAEKMPEFMRSISLLVALPRYEGYGMTPLEAMSSGVPFVAADTGYYRSFSGQESVGKIVGLEVPAAEAAARVDQLLNVPREMKSMSENAVRRAREFFSVEQEAAGIRSVYEKLWANGGS